MCCPPMPTDSTLKQHSRDFSTEVDRISRKASLTNDNRRQAQTDSRDSSIQPLPKSMSTKLSLKLQTETKNKRIQTPCKLLGSRAHLSKCTNKLLSKSCRNERRKHFKIPRQQRLLARVSEKRLLPSTPRKWMPNSLPRSFANDALKKGVKDSPYICAFPSPCYTSQHWARVPTSCRVQYTHHRLNRSVVNISALRVPLRATSLQHALVYNRACKHDFCRSLPCII